jgi:ribosomal protein S18 acetylase RimI-like enzyme
MLFADYEAVLALITGVPGVTVRAADLPPAIARYLARNPGLSFVAVSGPRIIGCLFCGHDGRRGYLNHVVVAEEFRRLGVGQALVTAALDALEADGIEKTHLDVFADNEQAIAFWKSLGWQQREDIVRFSFIRSADPNA